MPAAAEGVKSFEADELAQALKTIAELEAVKAASALFNGEEPISPKAVPGCPKPEQPGLHGALRMPDPGVSRHCYYEFKYHVPSDRQIRGRLLSGLVANIHKRSRGSYGMLRIRAAPHAGTEHGGAYGIRRQSVYS